MTESSNEKIDFIIEMMSFNFINNIQVMTLCQAVLDRQAA